MRVCSMILTAAVALISCSGNGSFTPGSSSSAYEVMVVADDSVWNHPAGDSLKAALETDIAMLPQPEPMFRVSRISPKAFNQITKTARNIIVVRTGGDNYPIAGMKYARNVYARPQLIVYLSAPSAEELARKMPSIAPTLLKLFSRQETANAISALKTAHNEAKEKAVDSIAEAEILIPKTMTSMKTGERFVWLSDNAAGRMENIVVYSYPMPARGMNRQEMVRMRDSVMRRNIPGEADGMYMETVGERVEGSVIGDGRKEPQRYILRGLWQMHGDAMGGPFVSVSLADSMRRRIITAEAFVYAPGKKKGEAMRRLEAALHTLKTKRN